jgi:Bacteriophage Lambda NinG protein
MNQLDVKLRDLSRQIVQLRDKNKPCIICGKPLNYPVCCHYFKQSQSHILSWDLINIHLGCTYCNNLEEIFPVMNNNHLILLIEREGESEYQKMKWLSNSGVKLSNFEKKTIISEYKQILKELQNDN